MNFLSEPFDNLFLFFSIYRFFQYIFYFSVQIFLGRGPTSKLRCKVLDRVLTIAVADHEPSIRAAAITSLRKEFDSDLAQAEM